MCAIPLAVLMSCLAADPAVPAATLLPDALRVERYRFLREPASGRLAAELRLDGAHAVRFGLWGGMLIVGDEDGDRLALGYRRTPAFGAPPLPPPSHAFVEAHLGFGGLRASR